MSISELVLLLGSEEDWAKLGENLNDLREILKPIQDEIRLTEEWWSNRKFTPLVSTD